jgi:hypothetical protein
VRLVGAPPSICRKWIAGRCGPRPDAHPRCVLRPTERASMLISAKRCHTMTRNSLHRLFGGLAAGMLLAAAGISPAGRREAAQHRHADDRRHGLERFRRLFGRRRDARPSDAGRFTCRKSCEQIRVSDRTLRACGFCLSLRSIWAWDPSNPCCCAACDWCGEPCAKPRPERRQ